MKKILTTILLLFIIGGFFLMIRVAKAEEHGVDFTANQLASLSIDITPGDSFDFGDLTFDVPVKAPATGTVVSVATNAANGYTLGVSDGSDTDSGLINVADGVTAVPDMTNGTITTPVLWGTDTGFGITLFAADSNKEAKWGTGTTYDDANNKYAAIPQNATTAHTVTGTLVGADTSSWAFEVETTSSQKTGAYAGDMTFTATAVLS